jgi:hypothetical protein
MWRDVKPIDITKPIGTYGGLCNRTACREEGAKWWNTSTRKYYCVMCASKINLECRRMDEEPILEFHDRESLPQSDIRS